MGTIETAVKDKVYTIYYKEEDGLVFMDWDGYATSEQFRAGSELMLQLVQEHKASKVLADAKDMILIDLEDQRWVVNEIFPKLIDAGCKTMALVSPHHYFNKVAIESLSFKANEKSLSCRIFHNQKAAKGWLDTV